MQTEAAKTEKAATAFRSIGEAAAEIGLPTHVLRFWETKFAELSPVKRRDGRRFYRPEDMDVLRAIQMLVHEQGLTIKGAQKLLTEQGVKAVLGGKARLSASPEPTSFADSPARELQSRVREAFDAEDVPIIASEESRKRLEDVLADMTDIKRRLDALRERRAA
jgi:DNA-binding transcriptional MerR regulator